jgi:DNA (cytosine-5)-methyltransferase 1
MSSQLSLLSDVPPRFDPEHKLPPLLSLFSGAGFFDLGLIQAGFRVIWSLEFEPRICLAHDYGMKSFFQSIGEDENDAPQTGDPKDIRVWGPNAILRQASGTLTGQGDFGIIGGPPCPDFSIGGKNRGGSGDRGQLTRVFIERICELEPRFFVIENVKGLLNTAKHRKFLFGELWKLEEKGYAVDLRVLNALHLGVPQDRERVFIIGVKRSVVRKLYSRTMKKGERNWFPWPRDSRYDDAKTRFKWPTTSPFGSVPSKPTGIPEELFVGPLVLNQSEMKRLPNGTEGFEPYSDKFAWVSEGDDSRKCFKRLHRYRYSPTVAYGNNEVHLHPALPRRLTVREALRIQTVPDSFSLPRELPLSTKFKLAGNGVPVEMARKLGIALRDFLSGRNPIVGGRFGQNGDR